MRTIINFNDIKEKGKKATLGKTLRTRKLIQLKVEEILVNVSFFIKHKKKINFVSKMCATKHEQRLKF